MDIELKQAALAYPPDVGQPWARQPRESDQQYAWFLAYRDSAYPKGLEGPFNPRNVEAVAEELGFPPRALAGTADSFAWSWRAHAFDRAIDERKFSAELSEVDLQRAKHSRTWGQLWVGVELEVAKLVRQMEGEAPALKPKELLALLTKATEMMRLLSGEHTAHVKVDGPDYDNLSDDEIAAMRALVDKSQGK